MYDTETRVAIVAQRVKVLRRKQENRLTAILSSLCVMLIGSLVWVLRIYRGSGQGHVAGLHGTTMMFEDAGGYVLVGVLAFITAVVITLLCIHYREKKKKIHK